MGCWKNKTLPTPLVEPTEQPRARTVHFSDILVRGVYNYPQTGYCGIAGYVIFLALSVIIGFCGWVYVDYARINIPGAFIGVYQGVCIACLGIWFAICIRKIGISCVQKDNNSENADKSSEEAPWFMFLYNYRVVLSFLPLIPFFIVAPVVTVSDKAFTLVLMVPQLLDYFGQFNSWQPSMFAFMVMPLCFSTLHSLLEYVLQYSYFKKTSHRNFSFWFIFIGGFLALKLFLVILLFYLDSNGTFTIDKIPSSKDVTFMAASWCLKNANSSCSFYVGAELLSDLIQAVLWVWILDAVLHLCMGFTALKAGQTRYGRYVEDAFKMRIRRLCIFYVLRHGVLGFAMFFYYVSLTGVRHAEKWSSLLPFFFFFWIGLEFYYSDDVVNGFWKVDYEAMQRTCNQAIIIPDRDADEQNGGDEENREVDSTERTDSSVPTENGDASEEQSHMSASNSVTSSLKSCLKRFSNTELSSLSGPSQTVTADVHRPAESSKADVVNSKTQQPFLSTSENDSGNHKDGRNGAFNTELSCVAGPSTKVGADEAHNFAETSFTDDVISNSRQPLLSTGENNSDNLKDGRDGCE